MNVSRRKFLILLLLLGLVTPTIAEAVPFERGDLFASLSNGNVAHYSPTGTLKGVYNVAGGETPPAGGEISTGMALDAVGNLYVTRYSAFKLAKLDNNGNLLNSNMVTGLYAPQSVAIDQSGHIYVGNLYAGLRKYDSLGNYLGTITPNRIEFFDLSLDESTIFYGNGSDVRRVSNSIPGMPGADFASDLFPRVFGMRLRTNGEWLVANQNDIKRLSPNGLIMAMYDVPGEDQWFALTLDPDGITFWAASYNGSSIYRFDIATGQIVTKFSTGDTKVGGLAICSLGTGSAATPAAPSGVIVTTHSTSEISVRWTDNSTTESSFNIERCSNEGCYNIFVQHNVTSYLDTGLTSGTIYSYRVRATNSAGNSAWSNSAATTTHTAAAPTPPTALATTVVSPFEIRLTWTDNSTTETSFQIERCSGAGCSNFGPIATVDANIVSWRNTGLMPSTTYTYRVRAFNGPSNSAYSNTAAATTAAGANVWFLPSSAHAAGTSGAFYTTDLTVAHLGGTDTTFTLKFLGHDQDGSSGPEHTFSLAAGRSVTLGDVLGSVFGESNSYGAIRVSSPSSSLVVVSQTSSTGFGGTFGQGVPAATPEDLVRSGASRAIVGIREDGAFRTNLMLCNATVAALVVDVSLVAADGLTLGSKQYTLQPLGMTQVARVVRDLGISSDVAGARLVLSTSTPGGYFVAYASAIDNVTNDPRTLLAR